jgi:Ca-activated chloride channel family protein
MRRILPLLALLLAGAGNAWGHGLLIPEDKSLPPLAMLNHKVTISIEDQVGVTRVEQTFRNHTDRPLEATYIFPVPQGASVNKFTMWVDGKETKGEIVEAEKARSIYTSIVRRTQDPGLLEYMGSNVLRMRVFPVPAHGDQRVALSYTSVANRDSKLVEYVYPLKTSGKAARTLEDFSITANIKSQHAVTNVYSPTHAITLKRVNDKEVKVTFDRNQGLLDKDFQLFYATGDKDIGLTVLTHRPVSNEKGYFTLLVTPRLETSKRYQVPRDLVLVLDTSGSMRAGGKIDQARKALNYCLDNLTPKDRFALVTFATTVNKYDDKLLEANSEQIVKAKKWVDDIDANGGTCINDALNAALELRPKSDEGRSFTVVFFTDGMPTIGEANPDKILKNVVAQNTANTRIFTFGVGDDVNATMLDQIADQTRALSTYVRPAEDIEVKVSSLYSKISNPVLTNLKLTATNDIRFSEIYPPQLPDLFHGSQLVVLGRYSGKGPAAIKLSGQVGKESKEFVYELTFPDRTKEDREFVEHLWARRKVGYMLDQIRANGEKPELVSEVVMLAKKYGITTPYTSYLIVPDGPVPPPVVMRPPGHPLPGGPGGEKPGGVPPALAPTDPSSAPTPVASFLRRAEDDSKGDFGAARDKRANKDLEEASRGGEGQGGRNGAHYYREALEKKAIYDRARQAMGKAGDGKDGAQKGKLGVDLSLQTQQLRGQARLERTALRQVAGRSCLEIGGVWIDEGYKTSMKAVVVKAQSDAYFRLLERHPKIKQVFQLGNHLVWVTPSKTALIIDTSEGKEKLTDAEIDKLFVAAK